MLRTAHICPDFFARRLPYQRFGASPLARRSYFFDTRSNVRSFMSVIEDSNHVGHRCFRILEICVRQGNACDSDDPADNQGTKFWRSAKNNHLPETLNQSCDWV